MSDSTADWQLNKPDEEAMSGIEPAAAELSTPLENTAQSGRESESKGQDLVEQARQAVADSYPALADVAPATSPIQPQPTTHAEVGANRKKERFDVRSATLADIPAMVEIDLLAFGKVYRGQGRSVEDLRTELTDKFTHRYELLGAELMPVLVRRSADGGEEMVGFVHAMRTNRDTDEFVSWEDSTNNGTLDGRHDPNGRNMYVVTLSVSPSVAGKNAQNSLELHAIGLMLRLGCDFMQYESRMPGLRVWVRQQCREQERSFDDLTDRDKLIFAEQYFGLKRREVRVKNILGYKIRRERDVPRDPLLAEYAAMGSRLLCVVPDAYNDEPSMNFGVLCVYDNPIPVSLRHNPVVRAIAGGTVLFASRFSSLTKLLF